MNDQLNLFGETPKTNSLGKSNIEYKSVGSILTPASGFMADYDYTLNPYSGCSFGCTYCYAAFFSRDKLKMDTWGEWVSVKENALALLRKKRNRPMHDVTIYMSSVTDPYQPIEKELELTRQILKELLEFHNVRLVVQTRSAMVTRDIDLYKQFETVQINMTVTTDDERVRKVFEPYCPGNKQRLKAIAEMQAAGVQSCITMTPLLPVSDPSAFAKALKETGITRFIIQPFHKDKGKFVRGTRTEALKIFDEFNWGDEEYKRVLEVMRQQLPQLGEGQSGFAPI